MTAAQAPDWIALIMVVISTCFMLLMLLRTCYYETMVLILFVLRSELKCFYML